MGAPFAQPSVPLAALRHRSGLSLVHPSPDDHRDRRVLAGAVAPRPGAGTAAGHHGDDRRLPAVARVRGAKGELAAAAVWPEAGSEASTGSGGSGFPDHFMSLQPSPPTPLPRGERGSRRFPLPPHALRPSPTHSSARSSPPSPKGVAAKRRGDFRDSTYARS